MTEMRVRDVIVQNGDTVVKKDILINRLIEAEEIIAGSKTIFIQLLDVELPRPIRIEMLQMGNEINLYTRKYYEKEEEKENLSHYKL